MPTRSNFSNSLYVRNNRASKKTILAPLETADLITDLRSYWKFEVEADQVDELGNNPDAIGAWTSMATNSTTGKIGTCMNCDTGDGDGAQLDSDDFLLDSMSFTFGQWVQVVSTDTTFYSGPGFELYYSSDRLRLNVLGTILVANSAGAFSAGFHFVIWWIDWPNQTLNVQVDNGTVDSTPFSSTGFGGPLMFGAEASVPLEYRFYLDELSFYRGRALRQVDRTALWNGGAGITYPFS